MNGSEPCLEPPFADAWQGLDAFAEVRQLDGQVYRALEGRRTLRFRFQDRDYFLKYHAGIGWGEVCKNLLQGRLPVTGASNEWRALHHLKQHGINAATPLAYGRRGCNPAKQESFLVMSALEGMTDLETLCAGWRDNPPDPRFRRRLIEAVARSVRALHDSGLNHRDLYLCHLWLPDSERSQPDMRLFVLDLHRAQIRKQVPRRWRIKDLGALYYSALDIGLTRRDLLRFLRIYTDKHSRVALQDRSFWRAVRERAARIYRRDFGREPPFP